MFTPEAGKHCTLLLIHSWALYSRLWLHYTQLNISISNITKYKGCSDQVHFFIVKQIHLRECVCVWMAAGLRSLTWLESELWGWVRLHTCYTLSNQCAQVQPAITTTHSHRSHYWQRGAPMPWIMLCNKPEFQHPHLTSSVLVVPRKAT
jgi:hypothetical protein